MIGYINTATSVPFPSYPTFLEAGYRNEQGIARRNDMSLPLPIAVRRRNNMQSASLQSQLRLMDMSADGPVYTA